MTEHTTATAKPAAPASQTLNVRVKPNVTLDNLQKIVAGLVKHTGCTTCGLLGVELRLSGDPVEFQQIAQMEGVERVSY